MVANVRFLVPVLLCVLADSAQEFSCEVDYGEGKGSWETMWSEKRKAWCCKYKSLACPTVRNDFFNCSEGLVNWKIGWSTAKKVFCCRHEGKGCDKKSMDEAVLTDAVQEQKQESFSLPLSDALKTVQAASSDTCGVSATLGSSGHFKASRDLQPVCGKQMTTNCSVSYAGISCPKGCDFLVPNHRFVCVFECVSADQCSSSNSNRAFPDPDTGICSECALEGCKMCKSRTQCSTCHAGFELHSDGSGCVFALDRTMRPDTLVALVKLAVCALVVLAIVWRITFGTHDNLDANMTAIGKARRHRHFCKVSDWRLDSHRSVRSIYPLTVNVHKVHILGVGLPLFYNSISFLGSVAAVFALATWMVYNKSGVSLALASTDRSALSLVSSAITIPAQAPAVVLSPLASCGRASAADIMMELREFAISNFHVIGALYVLTFLASLLHGKVQLTTAKEYDAKNKTMSDYALRISGLRRRLTNEAQLRAQLQVAFRKVCPEADQESGLEVVGVSICYDYKNVWSQVDAMKDRFMERVEVDLQTKLDAAASAVGSRDGKGGDDSQGAHVEGYVSASHTSARDEETMAKQVEEDREQAKRWFDEKSSEKLLSTGELFVVFKHHRDMSTVYEAREKVAKHLDSVVASSENSAITFHKVFSEPPSVNWWHLSVGSEERTGNIRNSMIKLLGIIVIVQLLIVLPYAYYFVWPYSSTGSAAGGTKMQIAGIILGNVNTFVSLQIFFTAYGLGFHRKDGMDMMILCSNTTLVMVNTLFNLATTAVMVFYSSDHGFGPEMFLDIKSLVAIGVEGSLAASFYHLMMPGTFFIGYLMCIVMAGVVPFVWNTILMKVIYIWRCLPNPFLNVLKQFLPWAGDLSLDHYPFRHAEKGFEPMEIGISWDYTSTIVTPTVCFCMLFFVSPYTWQTFAMLFVSSCFYYVFCRYQHLRFCKGCYYTTNRLDTMVNFLWGIPLSVIAAAWCTWGFRSGSLPGSNSSDLVKTALVCSAFLGSLVLWVVTYWKLLDPWNQIDAEEQDNSTFEEVKADLLYTWFNCNPVYVLKCEYYFQEHSRCHGHALGSVQAPPSRLRVTIEGARDLRKPQWASVSGIKGEPRCICHVNCKPFAKIQTIAHDNCHNPVWQHSEELEHYADGDDLIFTVLDKNILGREEVVGTSTLTGEQVRTGFDGNLQLENVTRGVQSSLTVKLQPPQVAVPMVSIGIIGAKGLRPHADWFSRSEPYCVCYVEGRPEVQVVTQVASSTTHPTWNLKTALELQSDDKLVVAVLDKDTITRDDHLGIVKFTSAQVRGGLRGSFALEEAGENVKATIELDIRPLQQVDGSLLRAGVLGGSRGHPMACGEDPTKVRFFEVGKEYLFVRPEKQEMAQRDLSSGMEIETILETLLAIWGRLANPCWSRVTKAIPSFPVGQFPRIPRGTSRDVLLGGLADVDP